MNNLDMLHRYVASTQVESPLLTSCLEHGFHDFGYRFLYQCMVCFLFHGLAVKLSYNATDSAKGEECIPQTWDMFHEK